MSFQDELNRVTKTPEDVLSKGKRSHMQRELILHKDRMKK